MVEYGNKCFVRFESLVQEGKHTAKEIINTLRIEFPTNSETAIKTLVLNSTWSEYRHAKISRLILQHHETRILFFC